MERKDNYEISKERAKNYFLQFPQEVMIKRASLEHDEQYLYLEFLGSRYRIDRIDASVERSDDGFAAVHTAGFEEVLSVFDLLGHTKEMPKPAGVWAPVNSLKHRPRTIGVQAELADTCSETFDGQPALFRAACEKIGGVPVAIGDIGYEFTVFGELKLRLKFYRADEEFPAQTVILWDENALEFIYYETAFYIMRFLEKKIVQTMQGMEKEEEAV